MVHAAAMRHNAAVTEIVAPLRYTLDSAAHP